MSEILMGIFTFALFLLSLPFELRETWRDGKRIKDNLFRAGLNVSLFFAPPDSPSQRIYWSLKAQREEGGE